MSRTSTLPPATPELQPAEAPTARASSRRALLVALLGIPLLAAVLLSAFVWPASSIGPRDLPIGVAGPGAAVAAVETELVAREGAFSVTSYADEAGAEAAIKSRDIYGAIAVGPNGAQLLTSTAASPVVAQLLTEIARGIGEAQGSPVAVRDVVAADPDDPRGTGLATTVLPMIILGIAIGAISTLLAGNSLGRVGVLVVGAVMAGLAAIALIQGWLGVLGGDWWVNAAVLTLSVGAVAVTVAGLGALLGEAGIGIAAVTMVLLGNPLSGATSAPELLSQPWGAIGQALPPGAGATLLRGTAFFDGAGAAGPLWTLLAWLLLGAALLVIAGLRSRRTSPVAT